MTAVVEGPHPARSLAWAATPRRTLGPDSIVELSVGTRSLVAFRWGRPDGFGTAAYWVAQASDGAYAAASAIGNSLAEEVCFCLLGGYGVTAEVNVAAYRALLDASLIRTDHASDAANIEAVLAAPLQVRGHDRPVRYRFPRQRAARVAAALSALGSQTMPAAPVELRDALLSFKGVGPKTASWIVRNYTASDDVAIIDVHLRRAGLAAGFFRPEWRLPEDYGSFEAAFLAYASAGRVPAGTLDLCIWDQMRRLGRAAGKMLGSQPAVG